MTPISTTNSSVCESSVMFTAGGPGDQGALVEVAGQQFIPSPFISLSLEKYKIDNIVIGGVLKLQLNGVVTGNSFNDVAGEIKSILELGQSSDCVNVKVKCSGNFIDGYGRIISISSNEGQQPTWVNIAPYSMEIEIYELKDISGTNYYPAVVPDSSINVSNNLENLMLTNFSEQFTLSVNDTSFNWDSVDMASPSPSGLFAGDRHAKVSFTISAAGINGGCSGGNNSLVYGMEAAELAISNRIDSLKMMNISALTTEYPAVLNGILGAYAGGDSYLDFRSVEVNTMQNGITVNGEIIYRPSGCLYPDVFTQIGVEENLDPDGNVITINGSIRGLSDSQFTDIIANSDAVDCSYNDKMTRAEMFLSIIRSQSLLKSIAEAHYSASHLIDDCAYSSGSNPCPSSLPYASVVPVELCSELRIIGSQVGKDYGNGTINFTFTLSNKQNCTIVGAKKVDVEITHDIPRDNIVEIVVPGRGDAGVLIQNLCCKSAEKYTFSINAILNTSRCSFKDTTTSQQLKACANELLDTIIAEENVDITCWFVTDHQETTGNNTYRLTKQFTKPSCP